MKKLVVYLFLIFVLVFTGCSKTSSTPSNPQNNGNNEPKVPKIVDYYPYKENVEMVYEGKGNEYAAQTIMTDFIKDDLIQIRISNGGTVMGKLIQNKNGELSVLYNIAEFYYKEDLSTVAIPEGNKEVILKEPLVAGTTWTLPNGQKRSITSTTAKVDTPSGSYTALEVTTEATDKSIIKDYYVLNIGFVKSVYSATDYEVTTSLKEIRSNTPLAQSIQVYYPTVTKTGYDIGYVKKDFSLKTNELPNGKIEEYFKTSPKENYNKLMSDNTKINKLSVDQEKGIVTADFSKELVSEMNAGSGTEAYILRSITNTLGSYYGVDKVYITLDGAPYSSGHIEMKQGETFKVDFKDINELK